MEQCRFKEYIFFQNFILYPLPLPLPLPEITITYNKFGPNRYGNSGIAKFFLGAALRWTYDPRNTFTDLTRAKITITNHGTMTGVQYRFLTLHK